MSRSRGRSWLAVGAATLGFAVAFAVSPPALSGISASAASSNYYSGTLGPNVKVSSGVKPSVTGGRSNFYIVNHFYNIRTENVGGVVKQTTTTHGQAADMTHSRVNSYFSLCWWTPITSGSWADLNANCLYYY